MRRTLLGLCLLVACRATPTDDEPTPALDGTETVPEASVEEAPEADGAPTPDATEAEEPTLRVVETPAAPKEVSGLPPEVQTLRAHVVDLAAREEREVEEIRVQHLLVSFRGTPNSTAKRNRRDAEALAAKLWLEVEAGADFGKLVEEHTDDSAPGIYSMTTGRPSRSRGVYPRKQMVPAFGNVGYRLDVGEVGVAPYHRKDSPYGWHIIKRLD